ncbi:MAG: hypothetical protein KDB22_03590 [Planctomycetales bacterium]|nr:hypothetical protein [Planctomycetales bacterium]
MSVPAAGQSPAATTLRPGDDAASILQLSLLDSVWGRPVYSKVRQSISIFDKQMSGIGHYVRGGRGSGKLKFELRFSAHDHLNTLLQVCDGQRLLTIEDNGQQRTRVEVDLARIQAPLSRNYDSVTDPIVSMYLAVGGQAEVLRKLCQMYQWTYVRNGKVEKTPVWLLSGSLRTEPPQQRSLAEVDIRLFDENKSGLLPTHVEASIGTSDSEFPFWLHRLVQTRGPAEPSPSGRSFSIRVLTEWATPVAMTPDQLTSDIFHAPPAAGEQFSDETSRYLPPQPAFQAQLPAPLHH